MEPEILKPKKANPSIITVIHTPAGVNKGLLKRSHEFLKGIYL